MSGRSGVARKVVAVILMTGLAVMARAGESNALYDANCALCHQTRAVGLAGQFPRLAGRVDRMAANAQARRHLICVLLFGMVGKIEVDGTAINGVMPSFSALSDADLASVLTYLIRLGGPDSANVPAIEAAEVDALRSGTRLSSREVHDKRAALVASHTIP